MAASLVDYAGSSGEDEGEEESHTKVDYLESSKVLSSLKNRILIDSTPAVPNKVGGAKILTLLVGVM